MGILRKFMDYMTSDGTRPSPPKVGRNEPCHCGSGLKYKRCCFDSDEAVRYEASCKCSASS